MDETVAKPIGMGVIAAILWGIFGLFTRNADWAWQMSLIALGWIALFGFAGLKCGGRSMSCRIFFAILIDFCACAAYGYGFWRICSGWGPGYEGWKEIAYGAFFVFWFLAAIRFALLALSNAFADILWVFLSFRKNPEGDRRREKMIRAMSDLAHQEDGKAIVIDLSDDDRKDRTRKDR